MTLKCGISSRNPREALLKFPSRSAARPVPPVLVTGLFTKLLPKVMLLRVLSCVNGEGDRSTNLLPELQLVAALDPHERVFNLVVELAGIDGQERRSAGMRLKSVMSMFGKPVVISLTLIPRMPSDVAESSP